MSSRRHIGPGAWVSSDEAEMMDEYERIISELEEERDIFKRTLDKRDERITELEEERDAMRDAYERDSGLPWWKALGEE